MRRGALLFPALILVAVSLLLIVGLFVLEYSWTAIAFPLVAGVLLCGLCVLEMTRVLARRAGTVPAERVESDQLAPHHSLSSIAWMFALAVFLYGLGFVFGPAAYLITCLRANGFSWRLSVGVAVASMLFTWGLFIKVMGILLPIQPLWLS